MKGEHSLDKICSRSESDSFFDADVKQRSLMHLSGAFWIDLQQPTISVSASLVTFLHASKHFIVSVSHFPDRPQSWSTVHSNNSHSSNFFPFVCNQPDSVHFTSIIFLGLEGTGLHSRVTRAPRDDEKCVSKFSSARVFVRSSCLH